MALRFTGFQGEIPSTAPRLLPEAAAQTARDLRIGSGALRPTRELALAYTFSSDVATFIRHQGEWLGWNDGVEAVPGPIAADRLYLTGIGNPKMRVGATTYELALHAPSAAPTVTLLGTLDSAEAEAIFYAYTFVTSMDEESQPSPLSGTLMWSEGLVVRVSGFSAPQASRGVDRIRLYRSQTGETGATSLYFVDEFPVATSSRDHDIALAPLQEPIPSVDYDPPPTFLRNITALPNGMMVARSGKEVCFSEPWLPHAWPIKYRMTVDFHIVGFASFGSTLAILTQGTPYIAQGTHPDSMAMEKVEASLPCLSARGIVDMGYAALYPSPEGLVRVSQSGAEVISRSLFTREQWNERRPATFVSATFDGQYLFSYDDGTGRKMSGIDMTGAQPTLIRHSPAATAMFTDSDGALYVQVGARTIYQWEKLDAPRRTFLWKGRRMQFPAARGFAVIQIDAEGGGAFACRIYADGALKHTVTQRNMPKRLPAGPHTVWEIEIETDREVTGISLATSMLDLEAG